MDTSKLDVHKKHAVTKNQGGKGRMARMVAEMCAARIVCSAERVGWK